MYRTSLAYGRGKKESKGEKKIVVPKVYRLGARCLSASPSAWLKARPRLLFHLSRFHRHSARGYNIEMVNKNIAVAEPIRDSCDDASVALLCLFALYTSAPTEMGVSCHPFTPLIILYFLVRTEKEENGGKNTYGKKRTQPDARLLTDERLNKCDRGKQVNTVEFPLVTTTYIHSRARRLHSGRYAGVVVYAYLDLHPTKRW